MFSRHHRQLRVFFGLSDILLTALAFVAAYELRIRLELAREFYIPGITRTLLLLFAVIVWVSLGYWLRIYEKLDSAVPRVILRDTFRQCATGAVAVVLFEFLLRLDLSRAFLAMFAVFAWMLLCLFRLNAGNLLGVIRREFGSPNYVVVVGVGDSAIRLGRMLEQSETYGVRIRAFFTDDAEHPGEVALDKTYPVRALDDLPGMLREHVIDDILFAVDSRKLAELEELFLLCDEEGVKTRVATDFFPHVHSDVYLDWLGSLPLLTFSAAPHDEIRLVAKRITDIVMAAAALVLLAPLMAVIAMLIRLTSPGPAIFRQERCGLNGRRFVFYKFRSMCENAEALKASLQHLNQRETVFKIPNDPRLTGVGRWLRKFSIDEWPQLWNVLKGDMSLVGPRPAVPEEVEQYKRWQRRRLRMRPGLTCLWAISGRDALDFETWMKMDMQYIDNWSLALDWKIILQTIPHVLTGRGAH